MSNPLFTLEPDMSIEPGHQWIILPTTAEGNALAKLLTGKEELISFLDVYSKGGMTLKIRHDYDVDKNIVKLIDELAHVRFSAPGLIQMTLTEATQESQA